MPRPRIPLQVGAWKMATCRGAGSSGIRDKSAQSYLPEDEAGVAVSMTRDMKHSDIHHKSESQDTNFH